jgi:hypothetical protein
MLYVEESKLPVPIVPGEFQKEDGGPFHGMIPPPDAPLPDVEPPPDFVAVTPVQNADALISRPELDKFLARAAKIVRDKLPKGGLKDAEASSGVKNYLLKSSGKSGFRFISATVFETLLTALEAGTPENAAAIVKAAK